MEPRPLRCLAHAADVVGLRDRRGIHAPRRILQAGGTAARRAAMARDGLAQDLSGFGLNRLRCAGLALNRPTGMNADVMSIRRAASWNRTPATARPRGRV